MNYYENFRRGQKKAIYSDGFFNTVREHRYTTELAAGTELRFPPPAELIPRRSAPFEAYHSCPHLASLTTASPAVCSTTSLTNGDSEAESPSTSLVTGLPSRGLDCMPLLVFVLVLCVFITLAIWATALVQDEAHDSRMEAVDGVDSGQPFAKFGGLEQSAGVSEQKGTKKQVLKMTASNGKRRRGKRASTTLDGIDATTMSLEHRTVDDKEDDREQPSVIGGKHKTGSSDNEGTTITSPLKPIHRRRRFPRNRPSHRSARRRASKRIQRSREATKQAAPPTVYSEKGGSDADF